MRALLLLFASTPAWALDGGLSVEVGSLANPDPGYDLFSNVNAMPSVGLRGALEIVERLDIVGGWHRVHRGSDIEFISFDEDLNFEVDELVLRAAFFADEFALGPKVDLEIQEIVYPYLSAQGLLFRGVIKLDDDPTTKNNVNQLREDGLTFGFLTMGGVELRYPQGSFPLTGSFHLEMGYGWMVAADFGTLGDMKPGGYAVRSGIGVRF